MASPLRHYEMTNTQAASNLGHKRNRARNLLHEERVAIGVEAHFASAKEVAEKWGIATQTVSQIKGGFIQTEEQRETGKNTTLERDIKTIVDKKRKVIIKESTRKLLMAMDVITKEKLEDAGVRVAAGVARDMAIVADKAASLGQPKFGDGSGGISATFNIHPPAVMKESDFGPIIEVPIEKER